MARLGSFDVAGRVDNTSMLVGTEVYKKVASSKNYKIDAVRRFILEGLSPETGGLLKYHEIGYDGNEYLTPQDFVNNLVPDVEVLRYHLLVIRINEDKFLFTRQGVNIGENSDAVEEEDFIALSGISAGTIRQLIQELRDLIEETSLNQSDSLSDEINNRIAAVNVLSQAITTESTARAALSTSVNAAIQSEASTRQAAVNTLNEALVTESTARATLSTNLNAAIQDEASDRQAAVNTLNQAIVDEASARATLATELNAAITDETSAREAAVTTLSESIVDESSARATLETALNAAIEDEASIRSAAVNTLNQSIVDESSARATLGTNLTAAISTEASNRQAAVNTLQTAITTESTSRAALETALTAAIEDETSAREAAVTTLNQSIVDESSARATLGTNLNAAIATETTNRQSAVTTLQQADTTEAQTRAALGTTLTAAIATETTNRQAAITTLNTAIADETSARTTAVTNLNAAINTETTNRQAAVTTLQQADTTEASVRAALGTTLTAAIATETTNRQAAITSLNTAITDEASTRASAITALTTTVNNNYNTLNSSITTEANTRTTAVQAVANSVSSLTTTVNGNTASINTQQTTIAGIDGKLSASYGLSVDAGGRIASMKLLSNGASSDVIFNADKFKIYNGSSSIAPFTVANNQVRMTNVSVDNIVTPGTAAAYPSTGWNGLSVNMGNDNALRFRHANGQIGIEIGIIAGQLVLNWYNDQGVLVWRGGDSGIRYVTNIPASFTSYSIGLISSSVGEYPDASGLTELEYVADQQLAISSGTGEQQIGITGPDSNATFPLNHQVKYNYIAGVNPESSANEIYEGFHDAQSTSSPFITNGWWAYYITGPANGVFMDDGNGTRYLSLVYFKSGKPTNYLQIPNNRLSSGQN